MNGYGLKKLIGHKLFALINLNFHKFTKQIHYR